MSDRNERMLGDRSDYDLERAATHIGKLSERLETVEDVIGNRSGANEWTGDVGARLGDVRQMIENERQIRERAENSDTIRNSNS